MEQTENVQQDKSISNFEQMLLNVMEGGSTEELEYVLRYFPQILSELGDNRELEDVLTSYLFLKEKLTRYGGQELIGDFISFPQSKSTNKLFEVLRRSINQLEKQKGQLPTHLFGRLAQIKDDILHNTLERITELETSAWLKPVKAFRDDVENPLRISFEGHTSRIHSLIQHIDNTHLVSGSWDGTIRIWNIETGQLEDIFQHKHTNSISKVTISNNGKYIFAATYDGFIDIWDMEESAFIRRLEFEERSSIEHLIESNDSKFLIAGDIHFEDVNSINIWNIEEGKLVGVIEAHKDMMSKVILDHNGKSIISCSNDGSIKIWDITTASLVKSMVSKGRKFTDIKESQDRTTIIAKSNDKHGVGRVEMWNKETGNLIHILEGHTSSISDFFESSDGISIISASWDGTIRLWNKHSGKLMYVLESNISRFSTVIETANEEFLICGSEELLDENFDAIKSDKDLHLIEIWSKNTGELKFSIDAHKDRINKLIESKDGSTLISWGRDDVIKFWDMYTGKLLASLKNPIEVGFSDVEESNNGKFIIASANGYPIDNYSIRIWDTSIILNYNKTLDEHRKPILKVQKSKDVNHVISISEDNTILVWDTISGRKVSSLIGHTDRIIFIEESIDGISIISTAEDNTIKIWNKYTSDLVLSLDGHKGKIFEVFESTDNATIISASEDKSIKVWDKLTGRLIVSFEGHTELITSVLETPNAQYIISGSKDNSIQIWNKLSGEVFSYTQLDSPIFSLIYTEDSKQIIAGCENGEVLFFSIENLEVGIPKEM